MLSTYSFIRATRMSIHFLADPHFSLKNALSFYKYREQETDFTFNKSLTIFIYLTDLVRLQPSIIVIFHYMYSALKAG